MCRKLLLFLLCCCLSVFFAQAQSVRRTLNLNEDWSTVLDEEDSTRYDGFEKSTFQEDKQRWKNVQVPHNWDAYAGYRRLAHGNLHGYAWYRKSFLVKEKAKHKRFYLFFEGVGSYAHIWLNGKPVGYHAGGRTTFTIDVTQAIFTDGRANILAVRADHPAGIRDLPWVDGGCSSERGFSEGSQPLGIFRPVQLVIKSDIHITPFGVHYWNDESATAKRADIHQTVEIQNTSAKNQTLRIETRIADVDGKTVASSADAAVLEAGRTSEIGLKTLRLTDLQLWSPEKAYLYTIETSIRANGKLLDVVRTPYGVRSISWPKGLRPNGTNQLFVNGKPVFIHGIAEYEHKLGGSHAFHAAEISARVRDMKAMGFNSFRDAHQPHNLRYNQYWDENGILLWTQMAAHIWFDTPEFRSNFKQLLRDWVKERRNSPSVFLWGIENESTLPEAFANECMDIIRSLDPTASIQRLVTTCNGGSGTDWDVPQNWTGTYGGDHHSYGEDLKKQLLVGEYGAWRTLELHTEAPYLPNHSVYSEDRFTEILETKLRLADSVKHETIGHYLWLWNSHDNPGRVQGGEGFRDIDKVGPVNYKGLLTPWGEPTDAYYMYRAHYGDKANPMIYIASHTWPNRWLNPGLKDDIRIYSNCDEVELFNDVGSLSLGKQQHPGFGKPFVFNAVPIQYNVLYAEGKKDGKVVARDTIVLHHLPKSPNFERLIDRNATLLQADPNAEYLFRVNCGGPTYTDSFGQQWLADQSLDTVASWGSYSWADQYNIPSAFASQRRTFDPIKGTADWPLFQTFRYGLDQLGYRFNVPDGTYRVELYFSEPWLGAAGIVDATAMRLFDVAINGKTVEKNMDIWKAVGHDHALKRVYELQIVGGKLAINFPKVEAGQAIIQAIAIARLQSKTAAHTSAIKPRINEVRGEVADLQSWMDIGQVYDSDKNLSFYQLPGFLYGANFFRTTKSEVTVSFDKSTSVYALTTQPLDNMEFTGDSVLNNQGTIFRVYRRVLAKGVDFHLPTKKAHLFAFQEQGALQPAYDLKPVESYKAHTMKTVDGMEKVNFLKQERLLFDKDDGSVAFEIHVGVADVYSLTLKYHHAFQESRTASIALEMLDGTVLKPAENLALETTRAGKWNYVTSNTGTMINAGSYRVIVRGVNAKGVYIDALDVQ